MHKLSRRVRFSINPFLPSDSRGSNSLSSKPAAEGLAVFLELSVELVGSVEPTTGFVVNVLDIDKMVREYVVPIFSERIRKDFRKCNHISLSDIAELLKTSRQKLADKFGTAKVNKLSLSLNPFRKVAVDCEETGEEIGLRRLEARPIATLSIEAQERHERNERIKGKGAPMT